MSQPGRKGRLGEVSSSSGLLHGLRFGKGKHPGDAVIKEVRKDRAGGKHRYFVMYSGRIRRVTQSGVAKIARDRGFDVSNQRFRAGGVAVQSDMLRRSLRWQGNAKKRWVGRMKEKLATVTNPQKKARLEAQLRRLRRAPVNSPHTGKPPVSHYVKRFWR